MANHKSAQRGVTLIELIITLSIMAILASIVIPSFSQFTQNARRMTSIDSLWHAIFLARNEAIKRNSVVALCKSRDGRHCDNQPGNWALGWIVFDNLDHDEPAQVDHGEAVLRIYNATPNINISSNRQTFAFRATTQGVVNGTIVFCDNRGTAAARAIIISHTGRPRQSDRDASNHPLNCSNI